LRAVANGCFYKIGGAFLAEHFPEFEEAYPGTLRPHRYNEHRVEPGGEVTEWRIAQGLLLASRGAAFVRN
jgi:hypothetical protein